MRFGQKLIAWYLDNKRDLPWRNTKDPYKIWLSEIILQQTRVAQGLPYYQKFVSSFPTVSDLAKADEEEVLKIWQGLGYYSRARNLHHTAQFVCENLNGNFPKTYSELIQLKGIGSYTAAAISSFSNDEAVAVLDGNVYRVLARYFGIDTDISSSSAKKEFELVAHQVLEKDKPSLFNQAIMEFGALQCVPKNPDCESCIFNDSCFALKEKKVDQLPVKLKKTKITHRYLNYLVFLDSKNNTLLNKRTENGIWKNLYEFPLLETTQITEPDNIFKEITQKYSDEIQIDSISLYNHKPIIHKLSHQQLHINFWRIRTSNTLNDSINISEISSFPFPIVIYNFIESSLYSKEK